MKRLIVVDMQNDFVTGVLANPDAQTIIPFIKDKIAEFRDKGAAILYTCDTHGENYMDTIEGKHLPVLHCIKDSEGWEIVNELSPKEEDIIIHKPTFGFNEWSQLIKDGDDIYMCGTCTDICVISNALTIKASCPNSEVHVFKDGCAGLTKEKHEHALDVMASCQVEVL